MRNLGKGKEERSSRTKQQVILGTDLVAATICAPRS
jgi:hypothetical protein